MAAALVLISHFCYYFSFERLHFINNYFAGSTGRIGVCLFFAISGYLVSHSLEKNHHLIRFYWFKFVHIVLPYISSYLAISVLFLLLAFVRPDFLHQTPLSKVLFVGGDYKAFLFGLFPVDGYLNMYLHLPGYWFVGEWFIGTVVSLYLISPALYIAAKKWPIMSAAVFLALSICIYRYASHWPIHGFWFCLVRLPEFYLGILLHMYRKKVDRYERRLVWGCFFLMVVVGIIDMIVYSYPFIADRFISPKPRSFLFTIPMIVVIFLGCQYLNRVFRLHTINEYSKKTYVFMLIQHIMINTFMWGFEEQNLSKLGVLFSLLLVFGMMMYLSGKIVSAYKPIEDRLLHKNE